MPPPSATPDRSAPLPSPGSAARRAKPPTASIARRLLLSALGYGAVILVIGLAVFAAIAGAQARAQLDRELEEDMRTLTRQVDWLADGRVTDRDVPLLPGDPDYQTPLSGHYAGLAAIDSSGAVTAAIGSQSLWDGDPPLPRPLTLAAAAEPGRIAFDYTEGPSGERVRTAALAATREARDTPLVFFVARDTAATAEGRRLAAGLLAAGFALLLAVIAAALWSGVRFAIRPLSAVQGDIAAVREGRADRLPGGYPEEIEPLAEEVNALLDHNRDVVGRARTHVGNLAHALKTPLAVLRGEASGETALDEVVRRQVDAMSANVDHYLRRARAAARAQLLGARAPVEESATRLARTLRRLFSAQGMAVETGPLDGVFRGEAQDLEEMLGNLMENGCKWAASRVRVSTAPAGPGRLLVHVDDDGPGLTADAIEAALQRGVRLDEATPGTGLGLSIVADLALLYGGALQLGRSPLGGLRATLDLPAAPHSDDGRTGTEGGARDG